MQGLTKESPCTFIITQTGTGGICGEFWKGVYNLEWFRYLNEDKIISWRHWLHRHPELGFQETETSAFIEKALREMENVEVWRPTKTSVLAVIHGKEPGKTVALRADIDALPIEEESEVDFRSETSGMMHACGHDTHTAMLLGAAEALSQMTDQFSGTIKLIFQHAEEISPGGAQEILQTGVLDDVDCFYGSHIIAPYPAGQIMVLSGPLMAAHNAFYLTIQGRGSHGAMPERSIDPIMVGADIVLNINQIVARNVSPLENVVISFGKFSAGGAFNVIPDKAMLEGTVRTTTQEIRTYVESRIREVIEHICKAHGAEYELTYVQGYPAVINDEGYTEMAEKVATELFGAENCMQATRSMGSEDFSYYQQKAPGTYVILGGGVPEDGCGYINHHPKFKVMENAFLNGTKMYVGFALEALKND